eukprot:CAMPEP_0115034122 /NCGR_PEP_ID=MMETSP0216-20121206/40424_1 /TAXON_ID=223996 /ORGANISM="Protocruzia adherens, Strain Boccale" /LENGTH=829 /DNA_ID=CAMNT_0002412869 /DNA_START=502 /DNA_END=2991 /DNA_ORIENTATION=+
MENSAVTLIRGAVTVTTIITLYFIYRHYAIILRDKIIKKELHSSSSFRDLETYHQVSCIVEFLIVIVHSPPYVNIKKTMAQLDREDLYTSDMVAACWVLLRVYLIMRPILHQNTLRIQRICNLCNIENSTNFTFKMLMDQEPAKFQFGAMLVAAVVIGVAFRHAERIASFDFKHYWNGFYVAAVTMLTIGYGDFIPVTHFGRFLMLLASLMGWTTTSMFIVTITKSSFELNMPESRAYQSICIRRQEEIKLAPTAASLINQSIRLHLMNKNKASPKELFRQHMRVSWVTRQFHRRRIILSKLKKRKLLIHHLEQMTTKHERQFANAKGVMSACTDSCDVAVSSMDATEFKLSLSVFQLKLNTTKIFNIMYLWDKSQSEPTSVAGGLLRTIDAVQNMPFILHRFSGTGDYAEYMSNTFPNFEKMFCHDIEEESSEYSSSSSLEQMTSVEDVDDDRTPTKSRRNSGRNRNLLINPHVMRRRASMIDNTDNNMAGFQRAERERKKTLIQSLRNNTTIIKSTGQGAMGAFLTRLKSLKECSTESHLSESGSRTSHPVEGHSSSRSPSIRRVEVLQKAELGGLARGNKPKSRRNTQDGDENEGQFLDPAANVDATMDRHWSSPSVARSIDGEILPINRPSKLETNLKRRKSTRQASKKKNRKRSSGSQVEGDLFGGCVCDAKDYKSSSCICNSDLFDTEENGTKDRSRKSTYMGDNNVESLKQSRTIAQLGKVTTKRNVSQTDTFSRRELPTGDTASKGVDKLREAMGFKRSSAKLESGFKDKWNAAIEETKNISRKRTIEGSVKLSPSKIDEIAKSNSRKRSSAGTDSLGDQW